MRLSKRSRGVLYAALTMANGCTGIVSTTPSVATIPPQTGVPYFLPKTLVQLDLTIGKSSEAVKACEATFEKVSEKIKVECKKLYDEGTHKFEDCIAAVIKDAKDTLAACKAGALPVANDFQVQLSLKPTFVPDPSKAFVLEHVHNHAANDDLKIVVGSNGLLQSLTATAEDRTPQIVEDLASIAINILSGMAAFGGAPLPPGIEGQQRKPARAVRKLCTIGDVLDAIRGSHQLIAEASALEVKDATLDLQIRSVNEGCDSATATLKLHAERKGGEKGDGKAPLAAKTEISGILVASPQPFVLTGQLDISLTGVPSTKDTVARVVKHDLLPEGGHVHTIPIERTYFVTVVHDITLTNGMLSSITVKRPSPIEGFVQIPLNLSARVVELPGKLITLRYDGPTRERELEKKLLDAETNLLKAKKTLEDARNGVFETPQSSPSPAP